MSASGLRPIGGAIAGFALGFAAAMILWLPTCFVAGVVTNSMERAEASTKFLNLFPFVGGAIGLAIGLSMDNHDEKQRAEAERKQRQAEAAAKAAAEQRRRADLQRSISGVRALCSEAQEAALTLPTVLAQADADLDRAEEELSGGYYSPFWEAMENAAARLNSFATFVSVIESRRTRYAVDSKPLGSHAPPFNLGVSVFPDPSGLSLRMKTLYRKAQRNPDFASIYEQRRISGKIDRTNAILVAGFSSLGEAIENLGERTVDAIERASDEIGVQLGSIHDALESAAQGAAQQREAILDELGHSNDRHSQFAEQLRRDAENRGEHERAALRMLNNIQRHRPPSVWDPPV